MKNELAYFIGGIFTIYGLCCGIFCYRLIRASSYKYRKLKQEARNEDIRQMNSLLAHAYRILNNHEHKA